MKNEFEMKQHKFNGKRASQLFAGRKIASIYEQETVCYTYMSSFIKCFIVDLGKLFRRIACFVCFQLCFLEQILQYVAGCFQFQFPLQFRN